jgi:hypothetical protein
MLAGRPAFTGQTVVAILHATVHEQPPALTGSRAVAAIDRVIRCALVKRPADRSASADVMAAELRAAGEVPSDDTPLAVRALTRLVVLPFRVLRPDADRLPRLKPAGRHHHVVVRPWRPDRAVERHRRPLRGRGA